ncbi:hypothetical protein DY000_02044072 [Brassica cretica]|uniref:Uncharacterized protein n=1 Tax=Brassica cretica TaxID=69181 RepID=A0ABQ7BFE9_BRACR|nr:hypothetical protein DY000_02044072 [Brassica cretica]
MGSEAGLREEKKKKKEPNLRKKLKEKESLAKERLSKAPSKEGGSRSIQPSRSAQVSISRRSRKEKEQLQEEKRRGKRVISTPQLVWQPKKGRGGAKKTRSTEESIANTRSSGGTSGNKSATERLGRKEQGVEPTEADSVFNRLGGFEKEWGSKGSRGSRADHTSSQDLRVKLSGTSSGERHDGKSSKGSRSPPSVFERLGSLRFSTPVSTRTVEDSQPSKRRRQNSSDDRLSKKARKNSTEKDQLGPSSVRLVPGQNRETLSSDMRVSELICENGRDWDVGKIERLAGNVKWVRYSLREIASKGRRECMGQWRIDVSEELGRYVATERTNFGSSSVAT